MKARRWAAFLFSTATFVALAFAAFWPASLPSEDGPILVFCAAGLRAPVEAAARRYGHPVQLQFGGSQTMLANAELTRQGDLFIPADDSYVAIARAKGLAAERIGLARQCPVLAVARGNPKGIRTLGDLLRGDVRLAQANPEAAAIGKLVKASLDGRGLWTALRDKTLVFKPTVNDVANDLKLGTADAGFVWDATVRQYPELERLDPPELDRSPVEVSAVVLRSSAHPASALRFARFLAAQDGGQREFAKGGYQPSPGDPWEDRPELLVYAGAMLRPAIEPTLRAFERREGCSITRVYNGCGILVSQMQAGGRPDLFFACDSSFMAKVKDLFGPPTEVSVNQLVILVPKGNPRRIRSLKDLTGPSLKVGIGHERQCALGALTQETFRQSRVERELMKNVVVQAPTGDLLVNQLRTGSLDAVVAYVSSGVSAAGELEAVAIDLPCALAVQPLAIGRESKKKQIASRLAEALESAESRERFLSEGFRWKRTP